MLVGLLGPVLTGYKCYHLSGDDIPLYPLGLLAYTQMATNHTLHLPGSRLRLHFWYYRAVGADMPRPPFKKIINAKFPMTLEMEEMLPLQNYELFINQAL